METFNKELKFYKKKYLTLNNLNASKYFLKLFTKNFSDLY